ncbi:MAG: tetratricopeptide repeat protein [Sphingomonadales bacterium]|jgi:tetratricopeptide (TPR) repeat protein
MHHCKNILLLFLSTLHFCILSNLSAQSAEQWLQKGILAEKSANYRSAVECYDQAIKLEPALPTAWYNRGVAKIKLKQYSLAVVDLNKCILLDTGFHEAYFNRAVALWNTGNLQFALTDINGYIKNYPAHAEARELRYMIALEAQDWDMAILDLKWRTQYATVGNADALLAVLFEKAGKPEEAMTHMERAVALVPGDVNLQLEAATLFQRTGKYTRSMELLNRIMLQETLGESFVAEVQHLKADNYFFMKEYASAADIYTTLLQKDTGNANLMADYGHCLLQQEKFTDAEIVLSRAIKMKNSSPSYAYLGRGLARLRLEKGEEACADWEKSYKLGEKAAKKYLDTYCKKQE